MTPPVTAIITAVRSPPFALRSPPDAINWRAVMTFCRLKICLRGFTEQHEENLCFETIWNLAIVAVSVVTLILTVDEKPTAPLRLWISVYSLQCVVRMLLLWLQYKKRNTRTPINNVVISTLIRFSTILATLNSGFTQIWLLIGGWYTYRFKEFPHTDAPCLNWLALACVFPGLNFIIIRHSDFGSSSTKKGASDAGISKLPKYRFEVSNDENQADGRVRRMVPMQTNDPKFSAERVLLVQDAGCICLCNYEDGAELCLLPCNHHFHTECIRQWLMLKPTCPLCERGMISSSTVLETVNSVFTQIWLWTGSWYTYRTKEFPHPDAPFLYRLTMGCVFHAMFVLYIRAFDSIFCSSFNKKKAESDAAISKLPNYRFEVSNDENQAVGRARRMVPMQTNGPEFSAEHVFLVQDNYRCICIDNYEDGTELCLLPCNHHFHIECIRQWLMLKSTCPLCEREMIR